MQRQIRQEEKDLIAFMIAHLPEGKGNFVIPEQVNELADGGMGSLQINERGAHYKDLTQMEYTDVDGQKALITLTENGNGELFDLDIWKVDFSTLKKFPSLDKLRRLQ
jgi:hypothetical protein